MIDFYSDYPHFKWEENTAEEIRKWLHSIVDYFSTGKKIQQLNYIFLDDEKLLEINKKFLQHDEYTDIITFDTCRANAISGEMYISIDRVIENAQILGEPAEREFLRVLGHGLLHLLGQKDKTDLEAAEMRGKEEIILNKLQAPINNTKSLFQGFFL